MKFDKLSKNISFATWKIFEKGKYLVLIRPIISDGQLTRFNRIN